METTYKESNYEFTFNTKHDFNVYDENKQCVGTGVKENRNGIPHFIVTFNDVLEVVNIHNFHVSDFKMVDDRLVVDYIKILR